MISVDLMCFDDGLGCSVDDDDTSFGCWLTGGLEDDTYQSAECTRGYSWALELLGGLISGVGLLVLTANVLVNADKTN
jgi:hypothetical protein